MRSRRVIEIIDQRAVLTTKSVNHLILRKSAGLTLIELMLSIVLSSVLMLGITRLYLSLQDIYHQVEELSSVQNRIVTVSQLLNKAIRSAGYKGCISHSLVYPFYNNLDKSSSAQSDPILAIHGYSSLQAIDYLGLPKHGIGAVKLGTDTLMVQKADAIANVVSHVGNEVTLSEQLPIAVGEVLIVSDCKKADITPVISVGNQSRNQRIDTQKIVGMYAQDAIAGRYIRSIFYVGDSGRKNKWGQPIISTSADFYSLKR